MRFLGDKFRGFSRALQGAGKTIYHSTSQNGSLKHAFLVSGLGLSLLVASGELTSASTAQCDARYTPESVSSFPNTGDFHLPIEGEKFGTIENSHAKGYSIASYRANLPIEDKFDLQVEPSGDVFAAVLDGHGGWQVSEYGRKVLINNIRQELASFIDTSFEDEELYKSQIMGAIQRGYTRTDRDLLSQVSAAFKLGFGAVGRCGSCALTVVLQGDILHVANAGDIRAVLGKMDDNDKIVGVPLSNDHNAMQREEQEKLVKEHPGEHNVFRCRHPDSCYVKGALQPTRALGDFALKYSEFNGPPYVDGDRSAGRHVAAPYTPPYITAIPEVKSHKLEANDKFIIIGSDGLWDYLSNQEAADIVNEQIQLGNQEQIGRVLIDRVLQKASARYGLSYSDLLTLPPGSQRRRRHDDTTVIVLFF